MTNKDGIVLKEKEKIAYQFFNTLIGAPYVEFKRNDKECDKKCDKLELLHIPDEMLVNIFGRLGIRDIIALTGTCIRTRNIAVDFMVLKEVLDRVDNNPIINNYILVMVYNKECLGYDIKKEKKMRNLPDTWHAGYDIVYVWHPNYRHKSIFKGVSDGRAHDWSPALQRMLSIPMLYYVCTKGTHTCIDINVPLIYFEGPIDLTLDIKKRLYSCPNVIGEYYMEHDYSKYIGFSLSVNVPFGPPDNRRHYHDNILIHLSVHDLVSKNTDPWLLD